MSLKVLENKTIATVANKPFWQTHYVEGVIITFIGLQLWTIYTRQKTIKFVKQCIEWKKQGQPEENIPKADSSYMILTNSEYKLLLGLYNPIIALSWHVSLPIISVIKYLSFLNKE